MLEPNRWVSKTGLQEVVPMKRRVFAVVSLVIVMLMYLVPFYGLNGVVGPQTLLFWALISAAYLTIVFVALRGER